MLKYYEAEILETQRIPKAHEIISDTLDCFSSTIGV